MARISITFSSGYVKKTGEATLYAVTKANGRKASFNTGVSINPDDFDQEKEQIKKTHPDHKDLNLMIQSTRSRISEIMVRYRLQYEVLTPDLLKKEFKISTTRLDFHMFLTEQIYERRGELSDNSIRQHESMAAKLKDFSPMLMFSQLDEDFMTRFNRWMIKTLKNGQNTRFNTFKNLKAYLNIAVRMKIISRNPLVGWMPVHQAKTSVEFLTEDEVYSLVKLYDKEYLPENLQKILRHFLFMCFSGLRISDLRALQMDQIINGTLIYSALKTKNSRSDLIRVPLPTTALRLIKDESPLRVHGLVFETYSEQRMRKKIKDIIKVVGIQRDISLHTARHTFATMFLRNSKNLAVLQQLLGHSKIEQTMIYAHILTEDVEMEMENAFQRFN